MNPNQRLWNRQLQALRRILLRPEEHQEAINLFLGVHAMVYSAKIARPRLWSFQDEVWQGLSEDAIRTIPQDCDHSIAWLIWHIARIEDVTMNLLVAGSTQILNRDNWLARLNVTVCDTGNAMAAQGVADLSQAIDIEALRDYRLAVGRRTREIVKQLEPGDLKRKVDASRLRQVKAEGAVVTAALDLLDYWAKRNIAGLLLMPATRHNYVHLNEALRIKQM